ncbi:MAG: DUF1272 domain-containing protein [Kordiimonadaceae bacterium]|nr:DUF1272 domain-containing protein [Kordiimonadaceae bacterium]MBO6567963.1 DUF1272 domain-containing protein [Kordiimonadaceae bacterium]MBO6964307.1 DUF1272 domain-containing protein [Kordiimonadaceae bacterium]
MLLMKPNCEHCDTDLPSESNDAMICSYECTFCVDCVSDVLDNVCPNCGGGFNKRPTRPSREWCKGVSTAHQPPSSERVLKPVDIEAHLHFAAEVKRVKPRKR